jgi:bifunctional UDP-N-acetylglucosamine pyrophosphorylase / glucosamine-1-phosphate N-acetyltransferase
MNNDRAIAVVMAAGKGTRMKSDLPKVLFPVCGRPMLHYVLNALETGGIQEKIVVVGYRADDVRTAVDGRPGVVFAEQKEQLGTGHAVMCCRSLLADYDGPVMVVAGDAPMMQAQTVQALLADFRREPAACLLGTIHHRNPTGLGRILRDAAGRFVGIIEEKDATPQQRQITEVNASYYVFNNHDLLRALDEIRAENAQREYYLTDCPGVLVRQGRPVRALCVLQPCEALSVNNRAELAAVEAAMTAATSNN